MDNGLVNTVFNTEKGWIGLLASSRGLVKLTFPQKSQELAFLSLGDKSGSSACSTDNTDKFIYEIQMYFQGKKVDFTVQFDLSQATPFERLVWETTRQIPYGETRSYSWLAKQIGKPQAPRAVGQALGRNQLPIVIPCHRVLAINGTLGGFGGGLEMKKYLLDLESNCIRDDQSKNS